MIQATATAATPVVEAHNSTILLVAALALEFIILFALLRLYTPKLKDFLADFPTHPASVATALLLILSFGIVVTNKLVLNDPLPESYEFYMWGMIALAGVNVAGLGVKRFSDYRYREIKNQTQEFKVPAETVNMNISAPATPAPASSPAQTHAAGIAPTNPDVKIPLEDLASRQRAAESANEASD